MSRTAELIWIALCADTAIAFTLGWLAGWFQRDRRARDEDDFDLEPLPPEQPVRPSPQLQRWMRSTDPSWPVRIHPAAAPVRALRTQRPGEDTIDWMRHVTDEWIGDRLPVITGKRRT